jgi:hypothetical protein
LLIAPHNTAFIWSVVVHAVQIEFVTMPLDERQRTTDPWGMVAYGGHFDAEFHAIIASISMYSSP